MDVLNVHPSFEQQTAGPLMAAGVEILQINLGYRCNLKCRHCHVEAGPDRPELMSRPVMEMCLQVLQRHPIPIIDVTGGAPEMYLKNTDNYEDYMTALVNAFNLATLENVICKTTLSVAWDGKMYDCDFNQMLGMTVNQGAPGHIAMFDLDRLATRRIVTGNHCYGCTAGAGSSCRGEIA